MSGTWWPSKCLVKQKEVASPKYTSIIKRSDKWNLEWPTPLSLSLSLGRLLIVNIRIINASTVEPRGLCCLDWRRSQTFRNSFGKKYPLLNINIRSPFTKSKNKHLKEWKKKKVYFCQPRTEKQIIQVSNIYIFVSYFLPPLDPGKWIYGVWKFSPYRFIYRGNSPSTPDILTAIDLKGKIAIGNYF